MKHHDLPKWKTTASRYVVNDRWLKVRADTCVAPDGAVLDPWYVLEYADWIVSLVIDKHGQVALLRHYRQGVGEYVQELIAGTMDPDDTSPLETAKREMAEEAGYQGGESYLTGTIYSNPSMQTNKTHCFLAVGGAYTDDLVKEDGADFVIEKLPFADFVSMMSAPNPDELRQGLHIACVFFALNFIRQAKAPSAALAKLQQQLRELEG